MTEDHQIEIDDISTKVRSYQTMNFFESKLGVLIIYIS